MNPLISIVIPVFNNKSRIGKCIESILIQDYKNIEIIVIDGESTDGTLEVLSVYKSRIHCYVSEPDKGIYDAMNKGKALANGDWVLFIGSDDLLPCYYTISCVVSYLGKKDTIYYGDVYAPSKHQLYDGLFTKFKLTNRNICHQSIFYPKSIYKNYDYELKYKIYSDYEYNLRVFSIPHQKFSYIPFLVCIFNDYDGVSSKNEDLIFMKERIRIIWINYNLLCFLNIWIRVHILKKVKRIFV